MRYSWSLVISGLKQIPVGIERPFASLTGVVVGIYPQLSPLKGPFIFSRFISESKMSQLLSLQLWYLFKCTELT